MSTKSSFYTDGETYAEAVVESNEITASNTPSQAPSSFYPDGQQYTQADPAAAAEFVTEAEAAADASSTSAASAASSASAAATSAAGAAAAASAAVAAAAGTATPLVDGTAAVGAGVKWAREDHVHPTDASRAPVASPTFTGNPTAPTQSAGNNSTRLATTAYVDTADALKANIASPTFTGTPAAPTPSSSDTSTKLATTAFVGSAWTAYTPTVSSQTGTITTASATGAYKQIGKLVFFRIAVTITTNGTGGTAVQVTAPPVPPAHSIVTVGRCNAITGKLLLCYGGAPIAMQNYDTTYPGQNGEQLILSGFYEAA